MENELPILLHIFSVSNGESAGFTYPARLRTASGGTSITYIDEENGGVLNTLLFRKQRLTLSRADGGLLRFEEGKNLPGKLVSQGFSVTVQTETEKLLQTQNGIFSEVHLSYRLFLSEEPIYCALRLSWKEPSHP